MPPPRTRKARSGSFCDSAMAVAFPGSDHALVHLKKRIGALLQCAPESRTSPGRSYAQVS